MTARFVFDFGPVPTIHDPVHAMVVVPAEPENQVFYVADCCKGLERVVSEFPGDQIVVAPSLVDEARTLGLPCGNLPPESFSVFATAALDFAAAEHFAAVSDTDVLGCFLSACIAFRTARPWSQPKKLLRATMVGGVAQSADLAIFGPPEDKPGFTAYLGKNTLDNLVRSVTAGNIADAAALPQLSVLLEEMPRWIGGTMEAVLGAAILPIPLCVRDGERVHADDLDILTLAALALAASKFSSSTGAPATTSVACGLHRIDVALERRAT